MYIQTWNGLPLSAMKFHFICFKKSFNFKMLTIDECGSGARRTTFPRKKFQKQFMYNFFFFLP